MQKCPSELQRKIVVDVCSGDGPEAADDDRDDAVDPRIPRGQLSFECEEAGGDHHHFAGEGDERAFNRHEDENQQKSPHGGVLGDGVKMRRDLFGHKKLSFHFCIFELLV